MNHFVSLAEAQTVIEAWREEYNIERPHRGLGQRHSRRENGNDQQEHQKTWRSTHGDTSQVEKNEPYYNRSIR